MSLWGRPLSVRVRLTLWYTGAMLVVLGVYAVGVFLFVSNNVSATLDNSLRADFQWPAQMLHEVPEGTGVAPTDQEIDRENSPWLQVWSPDGKKLLFNTWKAQEIMKIPESDHLATQASEGTRIDSIPGVDPPFRVLTGRSKIGDREVVIQVGESELQVQKELQELMFVLLLGLPLGVAASGLAGYSLARRALAPVERMAERARSITADRLGDRLPVDNPNDELGRLAGVFNDTLTRLESSFGQMRRFTADASHELRTPLTAMRSVGEVGLRGRRDSAAYREIIGSMLEEVDRLARLVDRLLTLSRADNGEVSLSVDDVDLCAMADDVAEQMGVLAEERQQSITVVYAGGLRWTGDPLILRQALLNLVDNAIKYTPTGGQITIRVAQLKNSATLDVSDTGPGIPEELQSRVFDRFYRVDGSRSRENGGMGLGLSIAKWAVEVNGGRLTLEQTSGAGSMFRIALPGVSPSRPLTSSLRTV